MHVRSNRGTAWRAVRYGLLGIVVGGLAGAVIALVLPERFSAEAQLHVNRAVTVQPGVVDWTPVENPNAAELVRSGVRSRDLLRGVVRSRDIRTSSLGRGFEEGDGLDLLVDRLRDTLIVEPVDQSDLVRIRFVAGSDTECTTVVEEVAAALIEARASCANQVAETRRARLTTLLESVQLEQLELESELDRVADDSGLGTSDTAVLAQSMGVLIGEVLQLEFLEAVGPGTWADRPRFRPAAEPDPDEAYIDVLVRRVSLADRALRRARDIETRRTALDRRRHEIEDALSWLVHPARSDQPLVMHAAPEVPTEPDPRPVARSAGFGAVAGLLVAVVGAALVAFLSRR